MQIVTSTTPSGILLRSASVPGRCYGSITFGVGPRDEPVELRGITHLVLHLIETAIEPVLIPAKATFDEGALRFSASGTTAQVLRFFQTVSDAILALGSVSRFELARAKQLLEVEEPTDFAYPGVDLLTFRFGLGALGRAGFGVPAVGSVTKKDVARWASLWLTADNASVALTKPLSASFDLDLASGPRPFRGAAVSRTDVPLLVASENQGVAASVVVPSAGSEVLAEVLQLALRERLIGDAGLAYSVDYALSRVDEASSVLTFTLAPVLADVPEAVRTLVHGLQDIAEDGVSPAVLALAAEYVRLYQASDPASVVATLEEAGAAVLRGFTPQTREDDLAAALALTSDAVAEATALALDTLIVAFDDDAKLTKVAKSLALPIDEFQLLRPADEKAWKKATKAPKVASVKKGKSSAQDPAPTVWSAKKSGDLDGVEAVVATDALLFREDGILASVAYADLVLVGERPNNDLVLVDADGHWETIRAEDWKRGSAFVTALRTALPAGLIREFVAV